MMIHLPPYLFWSSTPICSFLVFGREQSLTRGLKYFSRNEQHTWHLLRQLRAAWVNFRVKNVLCCTTCYNQYLKMWEFFIIKSKITKTSTFKRPWISVMFKRTQNVCKRNNTCLAKRYTQTWIEKRSLGPRPYITPRLTALKKHPAI